MGLDPGLVWGPHIYPRSYLSNKPQAYEIKAVECPSRTSVGKYI